MLRAKLLTTVLAKRAAAAFTPASLPDLRVWLDAAKTYTDAGKTTLAGNNDPIYTAADLSGNGNDFIQATLANRPLLKTNIINGLPAIYLGGADTVELRRTSPVLTVVGNLDTHTIYIVGNGGVGNNGDSTFLLASWGGGNSRAIDIEERGDRLYYGMKSAAGVVVGVTKSMPTDGVTFGLTCIHDGSKIHMYHNGIFVNSADCGTSVNDTYVYMSNFYGGNSNTAYISEILIYSTAHDLATRTLVHNYLKGKYSINF